MDIGKAFIDAWNIYTKNFIVVFLAGIVAVLLCWLVSPAIGFQMMFIKAGKGTPIVFNDVFAAFDRFGALVLGSLLIILLLLLCFLPAAICFLMNWDILGVLLIIAGLSLGIYLAVCWIFSLLMICDQGLSLGAALASSRALVIKNGWWTHFLLLVLVGIVAGIGKALLGIGVLLTIPLGIGALTCAYAEESAK